MRYAAAMREPALETPLEVALGAMLGACVGDAAGAVLEFLRAEPTAADVAHALSFPGGGCWRVAPGQITDDGELTVTLAVALAEHPEVGEHVARGYAGWYTSHPFDMGQTTARAFGVRAADGALAAAMRKTARDLSLGSKANGSLMRATPLGVLGHGRVPEAIAVLAFEDSSLSHPNPSCCEAVACYAIAIASLVDTPGDRARAWRRAAGWGRVHAGAEVRDWLELAERDEGVPYTPQDGFVRIGFVHAFRHLLRGTPYPRALEETLLGGGDTDTNACIVGGLLGAAEPRAIPEAWRRAVLEADTARGRARPAAYHPRQLAALAPRLLAHPVA